MLTFLILLKSSFAETLMILTATGRPSYVPNLTSASPPEPSISSQTSISALVLMRSGSNPWHSVSLLKVMRKARFSAGLRLCIVAP